MRPGVPRADREEILAWIRLNPDATPRDVQRRWSLSLTTAQRYHRVAKQVEPPVRTKPNPAQPVRGTPARRMAEDDRELVVGTVRDTYAILRLHVQRLRAAIERGELALDRDTSAAMLNLQRMASGLIDAHPGLLELVKGSGEDEANDEDLRAILEAALGG